MNDKDNDLSVMGIICLTGAAVIWSNVSLHSAWTGLSFFYAVGLTVGGFLAFGGVMYNDWRQDGA